ncbi:MAG TPA: S8 family serine peptidase, partial [Saprospiraceae bacterium]|nr:S8 family serine peptidase [Saprospiraceae bacterium]
MSDDLLQAFEQHESADFWVIMSKQHRVEVPNDRYLSKREKGQMAFDQLTRYARESQASVLPLIIKHSEQYKSHYLVNVIFVRGNLVLAEALARKSEVRSLVHLPEIPLEEVEVETAAAASREIVNTWGVDTVGASRVWSEFGVRGEGAVVGNQDTGVEWQHIGLVNSYRGNTGDSSVTHSYNWFDAIEEPEDTVGLNINPCGYELTEPCDDNGHGTHTVGSSVGMVQEYCFGVAPKSKWIACRNMDRGIGTPETYISCFEWFLAPTDTAGQNPRPDLAPDVINNSWSCPPSEGCHPDNFFVMELAVSNLRNSGVVVVVSAGNSGRDGCGTVQTPAAIFESSFTVGAIQQNDTIAPFSSIGPVSIDSSGRLKPQLVAPGRRVRSSLPDNRFGRFSGTSMAGPHVAGAVALMVSANPLLAGQVDTIEAILKRTADPRTLSGRGCGPYTGLEE